MRFTMVAEVCEVEDWEKDLISRGRKVIEEVFPIEKTLSVVCIFAYDNDRRGTISRGVPSRTRMAQESVFSQVRLE